MEGSEMITVRVVSEERGVRRVVRVTAKDIAAAARLVPGSVMFPIDPEEFFRGAGPEEFHSIDVIEGGS